MQNERRTHPRLSFGGKAYLTYDGRCRCENVTDVSAEGLFLETGARIREGKQVKVFLPLLVEDNWRLCLLKGEVVRRVGQKGATGLGIQFLPGEIDTRSVLQSYVSQQAATC
jgi:hypothetical protein